MTTRTINQTLSESRIYKRLASSLLILLTILCFTSCEGYRCAQGTVVDKVTNLRLDSVLVEVITADSRTVYTDTSGKFDVCNRISGCVPNCKDIMIRLSKSNYKPVTLTNPEKDVTVMMEK